MKEYKAGEIRNVAVVGHGASGKTTLVDALAFAVVALAHGVERARRRLRWHPVALAGAGLLLAVASGLPGLAASGDFLRHVWLDTEVLGVPIKQGSALLFDLGVYMAVLGSVLGFLFGLAREVER